MNKTNVDFQVIVTIAIKVLLTVFALGSIWSFGYSVVRSHMHIVSLIFCAILVVLAALVFIYLIYDLWRNS